MSDALYHSVGGRLRSGDAVLQAARGAGHGDPAVMQPYWDFGWRPLALRTDEEMVTFEDQVAAMPQFQITGRSVFADAEKIDLTLLWSHPDVVKALGFPYTGTHQLTGSCVGAGGGNVAFTLAAVEVIRKGDPEQIILPFYPYTYGRSRYRSGMRGRGEGSTGSGWAEAATQDGILDNNISGLPKPTRTDDGIIWGSSCEMEWSAGDRAPCSNFLEQGRKHLIRTAARATSADMVREGLKSLYPATCASMYGFNARVRDGVLYANKGPRWSHQMSIQAWWNHPALGELFYIMNQWGLNAHGTCPSGIVRGGAWAPKADVDWICRTGEVYIFSQFDGYPAPDFVIPGIFL